MFHDIDTVFLDVGNTLISIDFDWVAEELGRLGVPCAGEDLRRAEAAARPAYSTRLFVTGVPAGTDLFREYLSSMFRELPSLAGASDADRGALAHTLKPILRPDGRASVLWRTVMPHVPEALARLRGLGCRLVVVSNSDGTCEQSLQAAELRPFMTAVIDSALVGYEKPDPRIFLAAIERTGAAPSRTLHVGDLYHADVIGARAAGLRAVLLDPYGQWPDVDCRRAADLRDVAEQIAAAKT